MHVASCTGTQPRLKRHQKPTHLRMDWLAEPGGHHQTDWLRGPCMWPWGWMGWKPSSNHTHRWPLRTFWRPPALSSSDGPVRARPVPPRHGGGPRCSWHRAKDLRGTAPVRGRTRGLDADPKPWTKVKIKKLVISNKGIANGARSYYSTIEAPGNILRCTWNLFVTSMLDHPPPRSFPSSQN